MSRIVWAAAARDDLLHHVDFVALESEQAAERVWRAILGAVAALGEHPHQGRPGRRAGTRELVVAAYPSYLVVYVVGTDRVEIVRIMHSRQRWPV